MTVTLRPLTYDDLQDVPDDGQRYEIIGGELIVTPAPTAAHQCVLRGDAYVQVEPDGDGCFASVVLPGLRVDPAEVIADIG